MRPTNIEDVNISQICYAHVVKDKRGNDLFINIYPHEIALQMFTGGDPVVVEVRRVEGDEYSRYWAWYKNYSKKPYMFIWPSKEDTLRCVPNYEQRTIDKEGRIVNVVVERWSHL